MNLLRYEEWPRWAFWLLMIVIAIFAIEIAWDVVVWMVNHDFING